MLTLNAGPLLPRCRRLLRPPSHSTTENTEQGYHPSSHQSHTGCLWYDRRRSAAAITEASIDVTRLGRSAGAIDEPPKVESPPEVLVPHMCGRSVPPGEGSNGFTVLDSCAVQRVLRYEPRRLE